MMASVIRPRSRGAETPGSDDPDPNLLPLHSSPPEPHYHNPNHSSSNTTATATTVTAPDDQPLPPPAYEAPPSQYSSAYEKKSPPIGSSSPPNRNWGDIIPDISSKSSSSTLSSSSRPLLGSKRRLMNFIYNNRSSNLPLIVYTLLSCFTRWYRIGHANHVVWDEAHFGKFGAYYINRTFYFDVHPPLGKMLVGLAGFISGFNGSFDFHSGAKYPEFVPYTAMRFWLAIPGILMVPLAWGTAHELRFSPWSKHIVTIMTLCDIAWLVISRFILLDSLLLFFTFLTVYTLASFHNHQNKPFTPEWWFWLSAVGIAIGCVSSVKWVGFFVTALVGLYTIQDLWDKFGDLKMPFRVYLRHWVARIACLIVLPLTIYVLCFKIHFMILNRSGPGDSQMSSLFQAHLRGNTFASSPLEPAVGSKVTLKNMGYAGGLLHSHVQTFPEGSKQQQVTCYHYRDNNNEWVITPLWDQPEYDEEGEIHHLVHGDVIRLVHATTGRNLHSHPLPAPLSKRHHEVSGYGNKTIGDSNDYWRVEIIDDLVRGHRSKFERVHSLTTRLRFRHVNLGCYLRAANRVLPEWGFKQIEVTCDKTDDPTDEHTYWNVESHWNTRLPKGNLKLYKSPFLRDFWHLNVAMMTSNNALVPNPDKVDNIASSPDDWPFLYSGMRMNGWGDYNLKFYLVGNPLVWWAGSTSLILLALLGFFYLARFKRQHNDFAPGQWNHFIYVSQITFGGWLLHYLPFITMRRVTYLHHYLPALYFTILLFAFMLDHLIFARRRFSPRFKNALFATIIVAFIFTAWTMRSCAWGIEGKIQDHPGMAWRKSWNLYHQK